MSSLSVDGYIDWKNFVSLYVRAKNDQCSKEPRRLFNLIDFMVGSLETPRSHQLPPPLLDGDATPPSSSLLLQMCDKDAGGSIDEDEILDILYRRYGRDVMDKLSDKARLSPPRTHHRADHHHHHYTETTTPASSRRPPPLTTQTTTRPPPPALKSTTTIHNTYKDDNNKTTPKSSSRRPTRASARSPSLPASSPTPLLHRTRTLSLSLSLSLAHTHSHI
mmetsp:Transcript_21011/g.57891  ORF Transcript_21011/g.57891 Transcript_21011/m.57891 type:complete len:220 (-) Transcript_21011:97-756(-)